MQVHYSQLGEIIFQGTINKKLPINYSPEIIMLHNLLNFMYFLEARCMKFMHR